MNDFDILKKSYKHKHWFILLSATWILMFIFACKSSGPRMDRGSSDLATVPISLPDREKNKLDKNLINAAFLTVKPKDSSDSSNCTERVEQLAYSESAFNVGIKKSCKAHILILGIGNKDTNQVYFKSQEYNITKAQAGAGSVKLTMLMFVTQEGKTKGFKNADVASGGNRIGGISQNGTAPFNGAVPPGTSTFKLSSQYESKLQDSNGRELSLSDAISGKEYVVLDFSSDTCGPCIDMAADFANPNSRKHQVFAGNSKCALVTIVSPDSTPNRPSLTGWIQDTGQYSAQHSYLAGAGESFSQIRGRFTGSYATPAFILLDVKNNRIIQKPSPGNFPDQAYNICKP